MNTMKVLTTLAGWIASSVLVITGLLTNNQTMELAAVASAVLTLTSQINQQDE